MYDLHRRPIPLQIPLIYRHNVFEPRLQILHRAAAEKLLVEISHPVHDGLILERRPPTRMRHQGTQLQRRKRILVKRRPRRSGTLPIAAFPLHLPDDQPRLISEHHILLIAVPKAHAVFAHTLRARRES